MSTVLPKGTSFSLIPQLPHVRYHVDVDWLYLENHLDQQVKELGLDLDPDFQRAHVWTPEQQRLYVEYVLQGGDVAKTLTFVTTDWNAYPPPNYALLDGKQRLAAVLAFLRNQLRVFGLLRNEFSGRMRFTHGFRWHVVEVPTRADVLRAYLTFNGGGVVHTQAELDRVRALLAKETVQP